MTFDPRLASDRSIQTIHAAAVFHDQVFAITTACANATEAELVLAAVSQDHAFRGIWTIPRSDLTALATDLEDGGWTIVFSPGADAADIEDRCLKLASTAFDRWKAIRRWVSAHRERPI